MTPTETAALLTVVSTYDRRTFNEGDVHAWHAALHDLPFDTCRDAAIRHYTLETTWVMPAHLRKLASAAGNDRAARTALDAPRRGDGRIPKPEWFDEVMRTHKANAADHWAGVWASKPQRPGRDPLSTLSTRETE